MSALLLYLHYGVEQLVVERHIFTLTLLFLLFIFVVTCQDIAVDSWAV